MTGNYDNYVKYVSIITYLILKSFKDFCSFRKNYHIFKDDIIYTYIMQSIFLHKDKLVQKYKHKWGSDVASQTKLDNFKIMKHEFGAEEYVKFAMSKKLRSTLVQLRAGCLPIEIELGRYLQIPRNERLCKQCTSGTVENEKLFLFHCTSYSDIRHDFTTEINSVCPPDSGDEDKIISLFSSRTLIIKTAHFIIDALKIRVS